MRLPGPGSGGKPTRAISGQMRDEDAGIADRVGGKRGVMTTCDRRRQSFSSLSDGERKSLVLLNPAEMRHCIPLPQGVPSRGQPCPIGQGHGTPRANPRPALLPLLPRSLRRREFSIDAYRIGHRAHATAVRAHLSMTSAGPHHRPPQRLRGIMPVFREIPIPLCPPIRHSVRGPASRVEYGQQDKHRHKA